MSRNAAQSQCWVCLAPITVETGEKQFGQCDDCSGHSQTDWADAHEDAVRRGDPGALRAEALLSGLLGQAEIAAAIAEAQEQLEQ